MSEHTHEEWLKLAQEVLQDCLLIIAIPIRQIPMEVRVYDPTLGKHGPIDVEVYSSEVEARVAEEAWADGGYVAIVMTVGLVDSIYRMPRTRQQRKDKLTSEELFEQRYHGKNTTENKG